MTEDVLILPNGRSLAYAVYGNQNGLPIIHMHGTPGSRLEAQLVAESLAREDICLIGIDRPGYGHSSMRNGWQITDIPGDVAAVADHLAISRFVVTGYSGGGPYALACARAFPERLLAVGVISGVGPADIGSSGMHEANRRKFDLARRMPWLARLMIRAAFSGMRGHPERLRAEMEKTWKNLPAVDQQVVADEHFANWMLRETLDGISVTTAGFAHEEILMASSWPMKLHEIHCPNLFLWHGCLDRNVPLAMGQAVARQLNGCRAVFIEGEGHISLIYHHGKAIIAALVDAATSEKI
jgi:pimeloyl-ACP methyl ester carboxylesterase